MVTVGRVVIGFLDSRYTDENYFLGVSREEFDRTGSLDNVVRRIDGTGGEAAGRVQL
jgi:hypothetical protein